jgi:hypothetical protein
MKNFVLILLAVQVAAAAHAGASQAQRDSLVSLLPASKAVPGWSRIDSAQIYAERNLYQFIDGGADLFLEYGFQKVLAAEYHETGGESINLEIYQMKDAGAAFGIFSVRSGRGAKPVDIGQAGCTHPYYVMFWKGRFYVSLAASDSSAVCGKGMDAIARAIDKNLLDLGQKPVIMELLPADGLLKSRYFRGYLGLSSVRLLELSEMFPAIDGSVGTYGDHAIILLDYRGESESSQRLAEIVGNLKSDQRFKGYEQRDQVTKVTDRRNQIICVGGSGSRIVITVSSDDAVAETACKEAITGLLGR